VKSVLSHGSESRTTPAQQKFIAGRALLDRLVFEDWAVDIGKIALRP
jgi:hypothetical protein